MTVITIDSAFCEYIIMWPATNELIKQEHLEGNQMQTLQTFFAQGIK